MVGLTGFARKGYHLVFMLLLAALLVPSIVAANISIERRLEDPISGMIILIVTNFPADLLLISFVLHATLTAVKKGLGDITEDAGEFVTSVLAASALVAVAGGVLDFTFLYERADDHYVLKELSVMVVLPAVALIFTTIALFLYSIVSVRPVYSLVIAAVIAPVSPIAWMVTSLLLGYPSELCSGIWIIICASLALFFLMMLRNYHESLFRDPGEDAGRGDLP